VQRFCKPKVGGSNPSPGTSKYNDLRSPSAYGWQGVAMPVLCGVLFGDFCQRPVSTSQCDCSSPLASAGQPRPVCAWPVAAAKPVQVARPPTQHEYQPSHLAPAHIEAASGSGSPTPRPPPGYLARRDRCRPPGSGKAHRWGRFSQFSILMVTGIAHRRASRVPFPSSRGLDQGRMLTT
jgi:hypothetical protein